MRVLGLLPPLLLPPFLPRFISLTPVCVCVNVCVVGGGGGYLCAASPT